MGEIKHGDAKRNGHHRLYDIRKGMLERCYNPNHKNFDMYGGRGIQVCDEWKNDYQAFKDWALTNGYANDLTIDRIDNDKNYCPENCRWVSMVVQNNNKDSVPKYFYQGEWHSISEWARILNMSRELLKDRITKLHWDIEKAFITPPRAQQSITYNGKTHTWKEWSEITGISVSTLQGRYYTQHWTLEQTLTTPTNTK